MPSGEAVAMAEVADLGAAEEAVVSAAVVAAVHFVVAVEAVRFAEAVAVSEVAERFAVAAVDFAVVDLAEASAEALAAMVVAMATGAVFGAATDSSLASATPPGIGRATPTILTIMDTPPIMVIRAIPDTIHTLTVDMAHTDLMRLVRLRRLQMAA